MVYTDKPYFAVTVGNSYVDAESNKVAAHSVAVQADFYLKPDDAAKLVEAEARHNPGLVSLAWNSKSGDEIVDLQNRMLSLAVAAVLERAINQAIRLRDDA